MSCACLCVVFLGVGLDQILKNNNMPAGEFMFGASILWAAGAAATCWLVPYRKAIVEVSPDGLTITYRGVSKHYSWGQIGRIRIRRILGWATVKDRTGNVILRLNFEFWESEAKRLVALLRDKTRMP